MSVHGAKEGFNDITALPDFSSESVPVYPYLLAATALALLTWLIWKYLLKPKAPSVPEKPEDPILDFLTQIGSMSYKEPRPYGTAISGSIRKLLCNTLSIPVEEKTVFEIKRLLPQGLRGVLPVVPEEQLSDFSETIVGALQTASAMMFSDTSEERFADFDHKSFQAKLKEAVERFQYWLSKEKERTRSVMSDAA